MPLASQPGKKVTSIAPRRVGNEATKKKPASSKKPAAPKPPTPQPPSSEEEDNTDESDAAEEIAEEEIATVTPKKKSVPKKTTTSATNVPTREPTRRSAPSTSAEGAPHLRLMDLVIRKNSSDTKAAKSIQFYPDFMQLTYLNNAVAQFLCNKKPIMEAFPTYNSIHSRTAIMYVALYRILYVRELCNLITYEESKILKALRTAHDFDTQSIPGPYVLKIGTYGYHKPSDARFDLLCPAIPSEDDLKQNPHSYAQACQSYFPSFPYLLYLCSVINGDHDNDRVTTTRNDATNATPPVTTTTDKTHWVGKHFVAHNPGANVVYTGNAWSVFGQNMLLYANRLPTHRIAFNSALIDYFPDQERFLKEVADNYQGEEIPDVYTLTAATTNFPSSLHALGLNGPKKWLSTIMSSLDIESKFMEGSVTLTSIPLETGSELTCLVQKTLDAAAITRKWHQSQAVVDEGINVTSHLDETNNFDLQVALLNEPVVSFTAGHADHPLSSFNSVIDNRDSSKFKLFQMVPKKVIRSQDSVSHQYASFIQDKYAKAISTVI